MNIRKSIPTVLCCGLLALTMAAPTLAQRGGGGGGKGGSGGGGGAEMGAPGIAFVELQLPKSNTAERELKQFDKALTLTPALKEQIKVILTARTQQIEALLAEYKEAAKVAAERKKTEAANGRGDGSHGGGRGGDQAAQMSGMPTPLERQLAGAAQAKLQGIRQEAIQKIQALLTEDQKKGYAEWLTKHAQDQIKSEALDFQYVIQNGGEPVPLNGRG